MHRARNRGTPHFEEVVAVVHPGPDIAVHVGECDGHAGVGAVDGSVSLACDGETGRLLDEDAVVVGVAKEIETGADGEGGDVAAEEEPGFEGLHDRKGTLKRRTIFHATFFGHDDASYACWSADRFPRTA